jgi:hypothetical protein
VILNEILANKRGEVAARRALEPEEQVAERAAAPSALDFAGALHHPGVSIIAEIKCPSPATGALRLNMDAPRWPPPTPLRAPRPLGADRLRDPDGPVGHPAGPSSWPLTLLEV